MKGKILMIAVCLWLIATAFFMLMLFIGIARNGSITLYEHNLVILYSEVAYTAFMVVLGFAGLAYELSKIKKGRAFARPIKNR